MKNLCVNILIISLIVLAWCWRNVEIKDEKLPLNDEIINEEILVQEEITNNDSLEQEEIVYEDLPLNTEFQPSISKNWVYFYKNSDLNRPHYFLTDKKVIRDNSDYTNFVKKFHYVFAPITINETTYTWCDRLWYFDDRFTKYIDSSIECEREGDVWYKITIPWGVYNAYLPIDQEISLCSITNPIVCWGDQKSDEEVIAYYKEYGDCPPWFRFYQEWVAWPTDTCVWTSWDCRGLKKWVKCWFSADWSVVLLWENYPFYR